MDLRHLHSGHESRDWRLYHAAEIAYLAEDSDGDTDLRSRSFRPIEALPGKRIRIFPAGGQDAA
jgi:hypothetical protein